MPEHIDIGDKPGRELLVLVCQSLNRLCEHVETQNGRIKRLETWQAGVMGAMAVILFVIPLVIAIVINWR